MRTFITWKCDMCEARFEFDAAVPPLRCPDCLSSKDHLHCLESNPPKREPEEHSSQQQQS